MSGDRYARRKLRVPEQQCTTKTLVDELNVRQQLKRFCCLRMRPGEVSSKIVEHIDSRSSSKVTVAGAGSLAKGGETERGFVCK